MEMRKLTIAAACAAAFFSAPAAMAADYPVRPITLVVPLGVGGSTDVIARIVAQGMGKVLGQSVIVENTTGAGGTIGEGRISRSKPDGYTFGIGQWGTNVASGAIYKLNFDLMKDFEPIGLIADQPNLITARKDLPANNLKELIAWLRENGSKANVGNSGIGTPSHVSAILLANAIGTKLTMVPYRGAGETTQALLGGQIDVLMNTPALSAPLIAAGKVKAFAVTAKKRVPLTPDIPTTDEAGLPGFYFSFWHALWAPKGTPPAIVAKLNDALVKTLNDPVIRKRLVDLAQDIYPNDQLTPEALRKFQQAEIDKWWPIIKAAGIRAQ
jgi:tripartite-type tricarboxylate transporter receptor subunit TctC